MSPARLLRSLLLALVAALVIGGLTAAPSVAAKSTGKISGTVSVPFGYDVDGVDVQLWKRADGYWSSTDDETSIDSESGAFVFSGLAAGSYRVKFSGGGFVTEWWDDKPSMAQARVITLAKNGKQANVEASLAPGGSIAGVVTDHTGAGVVDAGVYAIPVNSKSEYSAAFDDSDLIGFTSEGEPADPESGFDEVPAGSYEIEGVPAGTYKVCVDRVYTDDYTSLDSVVTCFGGTTKVAAGTDVTLDGTDAVTGKDVRVQRPASISGAVTGPSGSALAQGYVDVYEQVGSDWELSDDVYGVDIARGKYVLDDVPAGTYRICFTDSAAKNRGVSECWDDAVDVDGATNIPLVENDAKIANAQLVSGATIKGTVRDTKNKVIKSNDRYGGYVTAYKERANGTWVRYAHGTIDKKGAYSIPGLASGPTVSYRLEFVSPSTAYASEFHADTYRVDDARDVPVLTSSTVETINAQLAAAGSISGKVTGQQTAEDVEILLYRKGGSGFEHFTTTFTDVGPYTFQGIPAGTYRVEFHVRDGSPVLGEWWNDRPTPEKAEEIVVTGGKKVTKIDAVLTAGGPEGDSIELATPTISSAKAVVGTPLTVKLASSSPSRTAVTYVWAVRDAEGALVSSASGPSYTPVTADIGRTISVTAFATAEGFDAVEETSWPTSPVVKGKLKTAAPKIIGTPKVGSELTATTPGWSPGTTFTYRWVVKGGETVTFDSGQDPSKFTPRPGDLGKTITVEVSGSNAGYDPASAMKTSAATKKVAKGTLVDQAFEITGTVAIGSTVAVQPSGGPMPGGRPDSYTIQWFANGKSVTQVKLVSGNPEDITYTIPASLLGKKLSAKLVGSASGYTSRTHTTPQYTVTEPTG